MQKVQVGLIGIGKVAELHLAGCKDVQEIEVVAGAEINEERLRDMIAKWGLRGYVDYEEMLKEEDLDIVCICAPPLAHREITIKCAEYGVNILCEKPMALAIEDAQAMIGACDEAGVKFYYGSSYRCLPPYMKAKEMIDSGELGDIRLMLETYVGGSGPEEWKDLGSHHYPIGGPGGGGMGIVDHGIHLVDIFSWFSGGQVEAVSGRGNYSGKKPSTEYLTMMFTNGAIGQLIYNDATFPTCVPYEGVFSQGASWDVSGALLPGGKWDPQPQSIHVHGDKGALRIYHYANMLFLSNRDGLQEIPVTGKPNPGHFGLQMKKFAHSIVKNKEPPVTGHDGLRALKVILAAYESNEKGIILRLAN